MCYLQKSVDLHFCLGYVVLTGLTASDFGRQRELAYLIVQLHIRDRHACRKGGRGREREGEGREGMRGVGRGREMEEGRDGKMGASRERERERERDGRRGEMDRWGRVG